MGLFLCELCGEQLGHHHECKTSDILARINKLEDDKRNAELSLDGIRNAVYKILQGFPEAYGGSVEVPYRDIIRLWEAASCRWHRSQTPEQFLVCWIAVHRILVEAFRVFKTNNREPLVEKLRALRVACDQAREALGYTDSILDMSPEDVVSKG